MKNAVILVVDDEPKLVRLVREILIATGYSVLTANSGEQALELVAIEQPDLVIMDVILPGKDGLETTSLIRDFSDVPVIMLTARIREIDKLKGFESGVDDYMTKPFSAKELLARVKAVLKRTRDGNLPRQGTEILCGSIRIDLLRRKVSIDNREIHLTPTEYNLLHQLALHPNQVMFHEQLLASVWGQEYRDDVDYLRSYIHCLRRKLEVDPADPKLIIRSQGVGYMLVGQ
jgi:two-component system KDP operon response regulator KdpE